MAEASWCTLRCKDITTPRSCLTRRARECKVAPSFLFNSPQEAAMNDLDLATPLACTAVVA